jgi:hypothetical protein
VLGVEDDGKDVVDGHLEVTEARWQAVLKVEVAVQQVQQQIVTCHIAPMHAFKLSKDV